MPPGSSPRYKSRPGPAREVTETPGRASVPRCRPGALRLGPRPIQMKTMDAQGGRLAAAVASVANAVSTPPSHSQRQDRQSGSGGDAVEAIAVLLSIARLPPGHDPGADCGVATAAGRAVKPPAAGRAVKPRHRGTLARPGVSVTSRAGPGLDFYRIRKRQSVTRQPDRFKLGRPGEVGLSGPGPLHLQSSSVLAVGGRLGCRNISVTTHQR